MNIDQLSPPVGAMHYSEEVKDVYFAAYWKEGPGGCWAFVIDDRKNPTWTFHECCEIPLRAKLFRTAEQIAAEELQADFESALRAIDSVLRFPPNSASGNIVGATVRAMLEVGYRKQEQK